MAATLICTVRKSIVTNHENKQIFIRKNVQSFTPNHVRDKKGLILSVYGPNGKWSPKWSEQRRKDLMVVRENKAELVSRALNFIEVRGIK